MRILKIQSLESKSKKWVDRGDIMLHTCFQLLKDYVEVEHGDTHCNYDTHKDLVDEIRFLYNWWNNRVNVIIITDDQSIEDNDMLLRLMSIREKLWT